MCKLVFVILFLNCFANGDLVLNSDFFSGKIKKALEVQKNNQSLCIRALHRYVHDLELRKKWALYMSDATSRTPSGFFSGNFADMGSFDQCIEIEENIRNNDEKIKGKYCQISYPLKSVIPDDIEERLEISDFPENSYPHYKEHYLSDPILLLSLCIPSECEETELTELLKLAPEMNNYSFKVSNCQVKEDVILTRADWMFIWFLYCFGGILTASTFYDIYIQYTTQRPRFEILLIFSLYTNGKKLFSAREDSEQLICINGVRSICTILVILAHSALTTYHAPLLNNIEANQITYGILAPHAHGATNIVDTFILIGGLIFTYAVMDINNKKIKFNFFQIFIHRYFRLTPSLLIIMLFYMTVFRFTTSGPYWPNIITYQRDNCIQYWWSLLLYVQNYVNPNEICVHQSWYLSLDMQLTVASSVLLYILVKNPKYGLYGLWTALIVSVVVPFFVAYIYRFRAIIMLAVQKDADYMSVYYFNAATRFGPWIVGMLAGYIIFEKRKELQLNKNLVNHSVNTVGLTIAVLILLVIWKLPSLLLGEYNRIQHSLFIGLQRVAWAAATAWIIYICALGRGGAVNTFLSNKIFHVYGRLTYSIFLIHFAVLYLNVGQIRQPQYFTLWMVLKDFLGCLLMSTLAAILLTLAVESPILSLEKLLLTKRKKTSRKYSGPEKSLYINGSSNNSFDKEK